MLPSLSVVLGIKDQESAEDFTSLSWQVQTNCWPVLPPVHPRQSGKCAVMRLEREKGKEVFTIRLIKGCMLLPSHKCNIYNLVLGISFQITMNQTISLTEKILT